jgi:hypothetical protein
MSSGVAWVTDWPLRRAVAVVLTGDDRRVALAAELDTVLRLHPQHLGPVREGVKAGSIHFDLDDTARA